MPATTTDSIRARRRGRDGDPAASQEPESLAGFDAIQLLVERARDVRPGFRLTKANAVAVAEICQWLDGLPLALELAAGRLRVLSPEQVAARLGDQLGLLTEGARTLPGRQQTRRATLDWSYGMLAPEEQTLFERLSVFAGGFTLEAADVVAGEGDGVLDPLERLVSKSLVALDHERAEPRFRMLEPIRQYAAERLQHAGAQDELLRRHRNWVVGFAELAGIGFISERQPWGRRLREEQDNVRQALEVSLARGDSEAALRIVAALGYAWFMTGQPDGLAWAQRALAQAVAAPDRLRAGALVTAGILSQASHDHHRALSYLREALALFRRTGGRRTEAFTLLWLGRAAMAADVEGGRAATVWFEEALRRYREVGLPGGGAWCLAFLGDDAFERGDLETAAVRAAEAQACAIEAGAPEVVVESKRILGLVAARRGEYAEAERLFADVVAAYREADDRYQLAAVLGAMAGLASKSGQQPLALERLAEVLRLSRELGSSERMRWAIHAAIWVLWHLRPHDAAVLWGATEAASQGFRRWAAQFRADAAALERELGMQTDLAERRLAGRSLSLERAVDLALRVVEEELAAAKLGGNEAAGETPSTSSRGGRS